MRIETIENNSQLFIGMCRDISAFGRHCQGIAEKSVNWNGEKAVDVYWNNGNRLLNIFDAYTINHLKRTRAYVGIIADAMECSGKLSNKEAEAYKNASILHDLGKIFISPYLLQKTGKLLQNEYAEVKKHTKIGEKIVSYAKKYRIKEFENEFSREMCAFHHEKWDGTGYPYGLSKDKIPFSARIMAVADVYDALTNKRSYNTPISSEKAFDEICSLDGSHFDPLVVQIFFQNRDKFERVRGFFETI